MSHSKEFFNIVLSFAERVSVVTGISIEEALLRYTNLYKLFAIDDWKFNDQNIVWREFIDEFTQSKSKIDTTHQFYLRRASLENKHILFGCFRYEYIAEKNAIHIHFYPHGVAGVLSKDNSEIRKSELKDMFTEVKKMYPDARSVFGFSWLYNLESYRRLFPQEYLDNPKRNNTWFGGLSLWGQFYQGAGILRMSAVEPFLKCIKHKDSMDELMKCFPYQVLQPECDIKYFYEFFNVK